MIKAQTGADQSRDTIVMRGHAGFDAFVAARAFVQVDEQQVLALHQLLLEEIVERHGSHAVEHPGVHLAAGTRHFADGGVHCRPERNGRTPGPRRVDEYADHDERFLDLQAGHEHLAIE